MSTPRKGKFYPGWKMTWEQHNKYFRLLEQVYKAQGITSAIEKEKMRKAVHARAFGAPISAKEIDHLKGFDSFKATCLAILQPTDLAGQLRQVDQPLIRMRHACRALADEAYITAVVQSPRFKKNSIDDLDEKELTDLRTTLSERKAAQVRREKTGNPF